MAIIGEMLFAGLVSYHRFIEWRPGTVVPLTQDLHSRLATSTGIGLVDSTSLKVCHMRSGETVCWRGSPATGCEAAKRRSTQRQRERADRRFRRLSMLRIVRNAAFPSGTMTRECRSRLSLRLCRTVEPFRVSFRTIGASKLIEFLKI